MDKPEEEDKETESSEDRGESNENQVTKMFRWWREEKHLETKSFIIRYLLEYKQSSFHTCNGLPQFTGMQQTKTNFMRSIP